MAAIQRKLVHKQFNSPLGLYSDANVKETLDREMRVISNGTVGIETTDQYKPANLANSAVLRMLEEQEAVRKNPVNNKNDNIRKSRPRHRRNIIIDRETVLKINRRHPRRDFSWPPPSSDDSYRSRSSSEEIHFDDTVCKRNEIFHLKGMFDRGAIDKNKRNISRTLSPENVQQTKPQGDNNIDDVRSSLSPFFTGQQNINNNCHHEWPPRTRSTSADGESIPYSKKTFHIPDEEVHFGMIEPIRKYFERVAMEESENLSSSMKRWKSCENVVTTTTEQNDHRRIHSPDTSHYNSTTTTSQREDDKSYGCSSTSIVDGWNKPHPRQASSLNRYKSNSYNELPPLKPRAEYNKNLHSGKKKLNLNYSDKTPEKKQTTVDAGPGGCLDEKLKLATNRRVGENSRPTINATPGENKKTAVSFFAAKTVEDNNNNHNTDEVVVVINSQSDSNDRDDITANKNRPTTKIPPATTAEASISSCLKNNVECSKLPSSYNKLATPPASSTSVTTSDEFRVYQTEAANKIRGTNKATTSSSAPLVSQKSYDLASEQKCNAKNIRSHNLCDKLNENVNIISTTSTSSATTVKTDNNNAPGMKDTAIITIRPGITSATTVKNLRHIKIAPVVIVEEVDTTTMGHHHHHQHQHQQGGCSEQSTKLYDDTRMYHSRDSVDGTVRNCGDHKTKRDENLQDSAVEQENITQVVVRRNKQQQQQLTKQEHHLKDNDENVKKYHQQEKISKSDLSLSSLDKTDRRRGMYYTYGEYIWGPFDSQKSPFEASCHPIDEVKEEEKYKSRQDLRTESTKSQCLNDDNSIQISACNLEPVSTVHQIRDVHEPNRNEFDMIHIKHSNLEENKLLDIQKSIREDLRRIDEYMERAERTLSDAERHLYAATATAATHPQSDSILVLDTPIEAVIKHILGKRPSTSPSPSPAPPSFRSISTDKDIPEEIPPPPAPPIRQISYFRTRINEVENMPVVEHALLDLYNISRALDTLNNLTSIMPAGEASSRIVEINDSSKDETISSQRQSTISPYTANNESGSTSGTESGANIDKVIQSKNILSGYLITKQNHQEEVLLTKATADATVTTTGTAAGVGALFIPTTTAEKENRTVIVDLANGKTCHPSKATEGSNDPLKIDEQDSEIQDNGAAAPQPTAAQLANKSDCDTGNSKQQQVYGVEKSRLDRQLSSHHHEHIIQATLAGYDVLSKSCDDTPNKDNKFIAMERGRHANGAIHDKHFRNSEGVRGDNPNFTPSIHPQKQQTSHDDNDDGGSGGDDNGYHQPPPTTTTTNDAATNFHDTEGATTTGDLSKASSHCCRCHQANRHDIHKTTTEGHEKFVQVEGDQQQRGRSRGKHANDFNLSCKIRSFSSPAAPSSSPSSCADFKDDTAKNKWKQVTGLIRQRSFDRSRNASASPFMSGHSYPTEGYKRVAWPPVSEGSPVRGSTPQSQQTYHQDDQSQIPQQYGGNSPQPQEYQHSAPNYYQQSAPTYHQVQHPTQDQTSHYQQEQPTSYPEQDSYSVQGSYPQPNTTYTRQGSYPGQQEQNFNNQPPLRQSSTVAFSGGVPKKHTPSLPGQPQFQEVICDNPFLPFPTTPGIRSPKGWSHVPPPTSTKQTGYTSPRVQNHVGAQQPPFGSEQNSEFNQPQNEQAYQSPVSHQQPQFNQVPHHPQQQQQQQQSQQPHQPVEQEYYPSQGQQRGQSPGVITLRKEVPITQKPSPLVFSQPAATSFRGESMDSGSNMRGDLKWPPPDVKDKMNAENEQRVALTKGPAFRPRRVRKDYTQFFAKHALNNTYPGYKIPPGTQHVYAEF